MGTYQDTAQTTPATADGDSVAAWQDQGGNHALLLATSAPVLKTNQINTSLPCIRFDGSTTYFNFENAYLAPNRTVYAVIKIPGSGVYTLLCGLEGSIEWRMDTNKQRLVESFVVDIGFGSTTISNNTWTQVNMSWDGMNGIFRTAAAVDGTVSVGSNDFNATCFAGANRDFPTSSPVDYYATDLALLMEYAVVHTLTQKQSVEAWINSIWGV